MAAMASCCVSSIHCKPKPFPLFTAAAGGGGGGGGFPLRSHHSAFFSSITFSYNLSLTRMEWMKAVEKKSSPNARGRSVVCEAAPGKKADSAAKRARQAEKRRIYNKAHKSEIKTRMKKVLEELEVLKKKTEVQPEEILPIEKLIAEAYSAIDKAVKVGTLHRNTGAHRKSRLARRKKAVEIHHGWYTPVASV